MARSLNQWLRYLERLHPVSMELGLERVRAVYQRLGTPRPARQCIVIAGTNGKGSTAAYLDTITRSAGRRCGCYTSPHLLRYNERIAVLGHPVDDRSICDVFETIEAVRGDISLTYFEFGTLAALLIFAHSNLDLAVLEVGLGGRLDAVNLIDADLALITPIGLDHTDWLGEDRDAIGREKAGILRRRGIAVISDPEPPQSVLDRLYELDVDANLLHVDFGWRAFGDGLRITDGDWQVRSPEPPLSGAAQADNLAAAVVALRHLPKPLEVTRDILIRALHDFHLPGRFQRLQSRPAVWVDIAHNAQAAAHLRTSLEAHPCRGQRYAVVAMLADKAAGAVADALNAHFDRWFIAATAGERGRTAPALAAEMSPFLSTRPAVYDDIASAINAALAQADSDDQVIVFGSFQTVAEAMHLWTR